MFTELPEILGTEVRQFMMLPMSPDVLDRIELRGVAGQTRDGT